jgi:hypothetical protein
MDIVRRKESSVTGGKREESNSTKRPLKARLGGAWGPERRRTGPQPFKGRRNQWRKRKEKWAAKEIIRCSVDQAEREKGVKQKDCEKGKKDEEKAMKPKSRQCVSEGMSRFWDGKSGAEGRSRPKQKFSSAQTGKSGQYGISHHLAIRQCDS